MIRSMWGGSQNTSSPSQLTSRSASKARRRRASATSTSCVEPRKHGRPSASAAAAELVVLGFLGGREQHHVRPASPWRRASPAARARSAAQVGEHLPGSREDPSRAVITVAAPSLRVEVDGGIAPKHRLDRGSLQELVDRVTLECRADGTSSASCAACTVRSMSSRVVAEARRDVRDQDARDDRLLEEQRAERGS